MRGDHLEQHQLDAGRVDDGEVAMTPRLVGQIAQQREPRSHDVLAHRGDVVDLGAQEHAADRSCVGHLDELDPGGVAVAEDPAPALTVAGGPLAGDRPTEGVAPEPAGLVEAVGVSHHAEFHGRTVPRHVAHVAGRAPWYAPAMKMLRRALVALSLAGTIAGLLRVKGKGGVPPQEGGWREVSVPPR